MGAVAVGQAPPYPFDPAFERVVAYLCCTRPAFLGRVGHAIEPDGLSSEETRLAVSVSQQIFREMGAGPTSLIVVIQRLRSLHQSGKVTFETISRVSDMLEGVEDCAVPSEESILNEIVPVVQARMRERLVQGVASTYARGGDFVDLGAAAAQINRVGETDVSLGCVAGGAAIEALTALDTLDRLPTNIVELDRLLDGGPPKGTINVALGGPGAGKSMMLNHIAGHAATRGIVTAFATLELQEEVTLQRMTAYWTATPIREVVPNKMVVAKKTEALGLAPTYIKLFTPHATTTDDLKNWVKSVEAHAHAPLGLLVIDYADLMIAPGKKERTAYEEMKVVYESLRTYAREKKFWIWTACQDKGKTRDQKRSDINHMADSRNKGRVADLVVSINVIGEGPSREVDFFVAKNRHGEALLSTGPVPTDFSCGRMVPVNAP